MSIICLNMYDEIRAERFQQDQKWGGSAHDDTHTESEWVGFIGTHSWRAKHDPDGFRKQMIRVAALAVAAIESYDRRAPQTGKEKS